MRVGYIINLSHNQSQLQTQRNRDHCHPNGIYRDADLNPCKINAKQQKFAPVIFHHLGGFDSQILLGRIGCK